jgi:tetratricopeptide (TPR) repeat protein
MRQLSLAIFLLLIFTGSVGATDNQEIWRQAAENYDQGNYRAAADNYHLLLERNFENPILYYNLGNAHFKDGRLGLAIWSFRKALHLNPGFAQARANLEFARNFNTDQVAPGNRGFLLDIWDFLSGLLSSDGYLTLLMFAWWISAAIIIYKAIRVESPSWLYYLLILPVIIVIFSSTSAIRRINEDRLTRWGVLSREAADIREGPGLEFTRIEVGHEGLEFKILGDRENSYLIELGNGLKGWIDKEAVLVI